MTAEATPRDASAARPPAISTEGFTVVCFWQMGELPEGRSCTACNGLVREGRSGAEVAKIPHAKGGLRARFSDGCLCFLHVARITDTRKGLIP